MRTHIGKNLKREREERDWTLRELADRLGPPFTRQKVYALEAGKRYVEAHELRRLAEVLGVSEDQLLGVSADTRDEAHRLSEADLSDRELRIAALLSPEADVEIWRVEAASIILAGFAPGCRVLVDPRIAPKEGNVVLARAPCVVGGPRIVLRCYRAPFLVSCSPDPSFQPYALDLAGLEILGVAVAGYRPPSIVRQCCAALRAVA